jgi:hypothetical protein
MSIFQRLFATKQDNPVIIQEQKLESLVQDKFYTLPYAAQYDKALPREYYNNRYVWFGDDNLFPQKINDMYQSSAIHSAICDLKRDMICGAGYTIEFDSDTPTLAAKVKVRQLEHEIEDDSSLQQFIENITLDYIIHSVVYLKITWNADKTEWLKVERLEPSTVRVGTDLRNPGKIHKFYYSFDWKDIGRFPIKEYPAYDKFSTNQCEVLRFVKRTPGMKWYPIPQYSSATNWIKLDSNISLFHKSSIEQSTNPSKLIVFKQKPGSPEAKRKIVDQFRESFTGPETTGKSMIYFADGPENTPEVTTLQPTSLDDQYTVTAEQALRNICHAHRINPIILGIKTSHSLGNPRELLNALEIFRKTVVEPTRGEIEHILTRILMGRKIDATITLNDFELDLKEDERATVVATAPDNKIQE